MTYKALVNEPGKLKLAFVQCNKNLDLLDLSDFKFVLEKHVVLKYRRKTVQVLLEGAWEKTDGNRKQGLSILRSLEIILIEVFKNYR